MSVSFSSLLQPLLPPPPSSPASRFLKSSRARKRAEEEGRKRASAQAGRQAGKRRPPLSPPAPALLPFPCASHGRSRFLRPATAAAAAAAPPPLPLGSIDKLSSHSQTGAGSGGGRGRFSQPEAGKRNRKLLKQKGGGGGVGGKGVMKVRSQLSKVMAEGQTLISNICTLLFSIQEAKLAQEQLKDMHACMHATESNPEQKNTKWHPSTAPDWRAITSREPSLAQAVLCYSWPESHKPHAEHGCCLLVCHVVGHRRYLALRCVQ